MLHNERSFQPSLARHTDTRIMDIVESTWFNSGFSAIWKGKPHFRVRDSTWSKCPWSLSVSVTWTAPPDATEETSASSSRLYGRGRRATKGFHIGQNVRSEGHWSEIPTGPRVKLQAYRDPKHRTTAGRLSKIFLCIVLCVQGRYMRDAPTVS